MKILQIEAVNLNSLYGEHLVDLEAMLGGASLFLIYGPTGSGKSTLMDAVSLALFGETPRLDGKHGDDSTDPRAIMSRGTGVCSAAVIFSKLGQDGRQIFRARWACRRARGKADGKLQRAARSLEAQETDGSWRLLVSSEKKKEFAPQFDQVLEGFGVVDFKRSMLLAQGQFDAFLSAAPDQRADILERLTDTSLYEQLGERAAKIHRQHTRRLDALRTLAASGGGLDAESLATLEVEHGENAAELKKRKKALDRAAGHLEWFEADYELREQLGAAIAARDALREETLRVAEVLTGLAEHERCQEHRAFELLDAHVATGQQVTEQVEQIGAIDASIPELQKATKELKDSAQNAASRETLAAKNTKTLRPLATAAENGSTASDAAIELSANTTNELETLQGKIDESVDALTKAAGAQRQAREAADAAAADLKAHTAAGELARAWDPIRTRLDKLVAWEEQASGTATSLEERDTALQTDKEELEEDRLAHEAASNSALEPLIVAAETANITLLALLADKDLEAARTLAMELVRTLQTEQDNIQSAVAPVGSAREGEASLQTIQKTAEGHTSELETAKAALAQVEQEVAAAADREATATATLEHTRREAALADHRAALVEGEACPLCGAEAHPWSHDAGRATADAAASETITAADQTLESERKAHTTAVEARREADGVVQALVGRIETLGEQEKQGKELQLGLATAAQAALEAIGLPRESSLDAVEAALTTATGLALTASSALSALNDAHRTNLETERLLTNARSSQKAAESALSERAASLGEREKKLGEDHAAHASSRGEGQKEERECRTMLEGSGMQLEGDDPAAWRNLGDKSREEHNARVKLVTDRQGELKTLTATHRGQEKLGDELATQGKLLKKKLRKEEADRDKKCDRATKAQLTFDQAWDAALASDDTRPPTPPDADPAARMLVQETWQESTREAAEQARTLRGEALEHLRSIQGRRAAMGNQLTKFETAQDRARANLDAALRGLSLADDKELEAIRIPDEDLTEVRDTKKGLHERKVQSEALIKERRATVEAKARNRPETLGKDATKESFATDAADAEALHTVAKTTQQATSDQLRDHARAEKEQEKQRNKLAAAEQDARVWLILHALIGVNDGRKFKEFAQALNLGQLLDKANVHLARLAPRYRLIPRLEDGLPTLEFDLSDLWQAGDRVAPQSLSGGERFLVSLSLALGLSDFRAVKMPIETLLLDEGFGTLDPDTLSVALGALSQLQADGRQVGIISHVVGLRERIEAQIEVRPLGGGRSEVCGT